MTVSSSQAFGTYRLAAGAANFNKSITVKVGTATAGTVSVGNPVTYNSRTYSLVNSSGALSLNVTSAITNIYVSSGITSTGISLTKCSMFVLSGSTANKTTVNSGGTMWVSSGGLATSTTVNSDGVAYISSGGLATSTTVNAGDLYVSSGGLATSTTVNTHGILWVSSGGTATGTTMSQGTVEVGGIIGDTSASNGLIKIYGGTAYNTTVNDNCVLDVNRNGFATSTAVKFNGSMRIFSDGLATGTTVSGGSMIVNSGGTATGTTVCSGSRMELIASGATIGTTAVYCSGTMEVCGTASNTTMNSGSNMTVSSGGTASNTTVNDDSYLYINGGTVCGTLYIASHAMAYGNDGCFVFNLENRTTSDAALINSWIRIRSGEDLDYYVTVSSSQATGTYKLATGAVNFSNSITVTVDGTVAGTVTVGGAALSYGSRKYSLSLLEDSKLLFTISSDINGIMITESMKYANVTGDAYAIGDDVLLESDVIGGTVFGGIGEIQPVSKEITINGSTLKRYAGGGLFKNTEQSRNLKGLVTTRVDGSTFTSGFFAGADAKDSTIRCDVYASADDSAANLFFGGSILETGTSSNPNTVTVYGDSTLNLTDCISKNYVAGGSLISNFGNEIRYGDTNINVFGGTHSQIVGGSLIQCKAENSPSSTIVGDINISVNGSANIGSIYGASVALYNGSTKNESVTGDISIFVDVSEGASVKDAIVGGGAGVSRVDGNTSITIQGAGFGKDFLGTTTIMGDSVNATRGTPYVTGMRSLNFSNFIGTVTSRIFRFDMITIDQASAVSFTYIPSELNQKSWDVSSDSADKVSVNLPSYSDKTAYNLDFTGSELNFNCELEDGEEWTIFKAAGDSMDDQIFGRLDTASSLMLNGDELSQVDDFLYEGADYQLEYKFVNENNITYGMLVASKIA